MTFEFNQQTIFTRQLDVVDIGNCGIIAFTEDSCQHYIVTKTVMGKTSIFKFGPVIPDVEVLAEDFSCMHKKIDYKEAAICKQIRSMLNNSKANIKQAREIQPQVAMTRFPDVLQCYYNF